METPPPLTPFVAGLRAPVEEALRDLLGAGPRVDLGWAPGGADGALAHVTLGLPGARRVELDVLAAAAPGPPPWVAGRHLALAYRRPDGADPRADPALAAVLDVAAARFRRREAAVAPALRAALGAVARHRDVDDWMFRQLSRSGDARVGNLRLGFRCNQDCAFCWQARAWPEPPAALYGTWLDEMAAAGVDTLVVTGGEPTLHAALPGLVRRAARDHGMRVQLQTNAVQLRRPAVLAALLDAGLASVFVSLHSADPAVSDAMTRAPGTHGATLAGVEASLRAGLEVGLNCVVERANVAGLPEHAALVCDRFVAPFPDNPARAVTYSHPAPYHEPDAWARAAVPFDEVRAPLVAAVDRLLGAGVAVDVGGTCGFPPCLFRERADLLRFLAPGDVAEWDLAGRRYAGACAACAARPRCLGLRDDYVARFGDRGLAPFAEDPAAGRPVSGGAPG